MPSLLADDRLFPANNLTLNRQTSVNYPARSSPVSQQGESWVVGMVGARMEAGVQRLVLDVIPVPFQQGLEAGMVAEGGATGILHTEDSVASPVNSRD